MGNFELMRAIVLVLAVASVLFLVYLFTRRRAQGDLPLGLSSFLGGVLLGGTAFCAITAGIGYQLIEKDKLTPPPPVVQGGPGAAAALMRPSSKAQLSTLVRKLDVLTSDIALQLTPDQSTAIAKVLEDLHVRTTLTDDEAAAKHEELLAILDDSQKAKQDSINLPPHGPAGGGGGMGGGATGAGATATADANPFSSEENSKTLTTLLTRVGGKAPTSDETASRGS